MVNFESTFGFIKKDLAFWKAEGRIFNQTRPIKNPKIILG